MNTFIMELKVNNGLFTDYFTIYQIPDGRYEVTALAGTEDRRFVFAYDLDKAVEVMLSWALHSYDHYR